MSKVYWGKITHHQEKIQEVFKEYLGEEIDKKELSEKEYKYYDRISRIVKGIYTRCKYETLEKDYRDSLIKELQEIGLASEIEERITNEDGYIVKKRIELLENKEVVILEIKRTHLKEDINDLAKYIEIHNNVIGLLVCVQKKTYKIYMLLKEDMLEDCDYYCYDGEKLYKYKIHNKKNSDIVKEEKKKIEEIMTKENIEKWIKSGESYKSIAERAKITPIKAKEYCEKYGIKSKYAILVKEKKETPEDYKRILDDIVKYAEKQMCCKRTVKDITTLKEIEMNDIGIYGIFNKITKECIYIGSSENCFSRKESHQLSYESGKMQGVHKYMKENGGWNMYMFLLVEKRENHIGLNVIERIWWEALKPVGNNSDPIRAGKYI